MSYFKRYQDWREAHHAAIARLGLHAAMLSRIEYAAINDRLNEGNAKHLCELVADLRRIVVEDGDRVSHILGMRPSASERIDEEAQP